MHTALISKRQSVPLRLVEGGALRVGRTRVSLDSVIYAYEQGDSAEEIVHSFDTLELADVHAVLSFYLRHRKEVARYLARRQREAARLQSRIEAKYGNRGLKQRLRERQSRQNGK